jgi:hypothetical protein
MAVKDEALRLVQDLLAADQRVEWGAEHAADWSSRNGAGIYFKKVRGTVTLTLRPEGFAVSDGEIQVDLPERDYSGVNAFSEAKAAFNRQRKNAQRVEDITKLRAAAGLFS